MPLVQRKQLETQSARSLQSGEIAGHAASAGEKTHSASGESAEAEALVGKGTSAGDGFVKSGSPASAPVMPLLMQRKTAAAELRAPHARNPLPGSAGETGITARLRSPGSRGPGAEFVWRKSEQQTTAPASNSSDHGIAAAPAADRSVLFRQGASRAMESPGSTEQYPQSVPAQGPGPGLDLELLAEQVSRLIRRRLETECERRGVGL
jgi:hypothetical protein